MNVNEKFHIVPDGFEGTRRAVMIGINYVGQEGELSGCHNDLLNVGFLRGTFYSSIWLNDSHQV